MSGIIGHTTYAILGARAAAHRGLPVVPVIERHFASYLAGSYLGCDVQTLPAAICEDSGEEVGYGSQIPAKSPVTGGKVRPWNLTVDGTDYTPQQLHEMFYGRSHLVFGWQGERKDYAILWKDLPDYIADTASDAVEIFGPGERQLAYVFGWATHVIGDSLIKSIQPGIDLQLLDGKYTQKNRPVQDLITFNEIGIRELKINWGNLLADLVDTPVEPVQPHYMRVATKGGRLGAHFPAAWLPEQGALLQAVLAENRRYQRKRNAGIIALLTLKKTSRGDLSCDPGLSETAGGLTYIEMLREAERANFRHALWQMGERIAALFQEVIDRSDFLRELPTKADSPSWEELTKRWQRE